MFHSARLKITAWYLAIIMVISILFSFAIYERINTELVRFERMQIRIQQDLKEGIVPVIDGRPGRFARIDPRFVSESRTRLVLSLVFIDFAILIFAGAASYFLAGRTLRPIKNMMDEQNRFVSDASHELRTPLTSLRSEIEVALRGKKLPTGSRKLLGSNLEDVIHLQRLSDNLLELSKSNKAQNLKIISNVLINEALESAIKKLNGSIKKKNITIQKNVKNVSVSGVPEKITELFIILLDNAIKYSPEKTKIFVSAKKANQKVRIEIKDQGPGIPPEDLPHVFERFYRGVKSRSKEKIDGYGLGLSIARQIVDSLGGTIVIKSSADGTLAIVLV